MQIRRNARSNPGGDIVQAQKTGEYLEKLGVEVDVSDELTPDLRGYDIVHLFVLKEYFYENYARYENARKKDKCIVLSPVYWKTRNFFTLLSEANLVHWKEKVYYKIPNGVIRQMTSNIVNGTLTGDLCRTYVENLGHSLCWKSQQVELLKSCDMILPNSVTEMESIMRDFGISNRNQYFVVPNGADKILVHSNGRSFESRYGFRDFVMCAGRIEPEKNQLSLIRAVKGSGRKLVLIGSTKTTMLGYYRKCIEEADGDVLFIPWMRDVELASAYGAAKVHALPSWRETPGLASLEAGLAGCNIVTTTIGSTQEYFGGYAWYCQPDSIDSIRRALDEAFSAPRSDALRRHILENFTWEKTAEKTRQAYEVALGRFSHSRGSGVSEN